MKIKYYNAFENISNSQYHKEKFRLQIELLKLQEWILKNNKRVAVINLMGNIYMNDLEEYLGEFEKVIYV